MDWSLHTMMLSFMFSQNIALHDTAEEEAQKVQVTCLHEDIHDGYDFVVLTDISQCFESWHRASAAVPDAFARQARGNAGSRVPLFSAMVAFSRSLDLNCSSITFSRGGGENVVWFCASNNSKKRFSLDASATEECWTIISTPEYAIQKITETPMQDAATGAFIPQAPDYLLSVPAPELVLAFLRRVSREDRYGDIIHLDAQRWGSALPSERSIARDEDSPTRCMVSGVPYEGGIFKLAPTTKYTDDAATEDSQEHPSFIKDDGIGLYMASDMISRYSPGAESAVLSALECAAHIKERILARRRE
jgi:predicted NAD/FAD-dependent oxidoreductase